MKLLFTVDQRTALSRGINAASSTVTLDVDPSTLTQIERDVLAAVLDNGHDCRRRGIQTESDGIVGQHEQYSDGAPTKPITLIEPTIDGMRWAIAAMLIERDERRFKREAERRERTTIADAEIMTAIAPRMTSEMIHWDRNLNRCDAYTSSNRYVQLTLEYPSVPYVSYPEYASPEIRARYEAARQDVEAQRKAITEAALPRVRELIAERDAREAAKKAEYDALYARLPEALRARDADGFATKAEVSRALRRILRVDAGYAETYEGWQASEQLDTLTDAEHAKLIAERKRAPEGAVLVPYEVWDREEHECNDHDEYDSDCDDCSVDRINVRRIIKITWTVADVEVSAIVALDEVTRG